MASEVTTSPPVSPPAPGNRVRVFIDFWNLTLTMNKKLEASGLGEQFRFDWSKLPTWLASEAARVCGTTTSSYEGTHVYASYNPLSTKDMNLRHWLLTWLDKQPGVQVVLKERRPKDAPTCPSCHQQVASCPHCQAGLGGTEEKGIDTAIVTDMIRLAWEQAYDIAVLVSSDSDFVPAVQFLDLRGRKIVQAGFPPYGNHLATSCWASFDLFSPRANFER